MALVERVERVAEYQEMSPAKVLQWRPLSMFKGTLDLMVKLRRAVKLGEEYYLA